MIKMTQICFLSAQQGERLKGLEKRQLDLKIPWPRDIKHQKWCVIYILNVWFFSPLFLMFFYYEHLSSRFKIVTYVGPREPGSRSKKSKANRTLPQRSQKWSRTSEWADLTWTSNNLGSLKTRPQVSQIFWLWWNLITCFLRTPSIFSMTNWHPEKVNFDVS